MIFIYLLMFVTIRFIQPYSNHHHHHLWLQPPNQPNCHYDYLELWPPNQPYCHVPCITSCHLTTTFDYDHSAICNHHQTITNPTVTNHLQLWSPSHTVTLPATSTSCHQHHQTVTNHHQPPWTIVTQPYGYVLQSPAITNPMVLIMGSNVSMTFERYVSFSQMDFHY